MKEEKFEEKIQNFYLHLAATKQDYLSLFFNLQMQIERWFMGELMKYINDRFFEMGIENREVSPPNDKRKKVDLKIELNSEAYWIELKHIFVGCQHGNKFDLKPYFYNGEDSSNIAKDIKKLLNIPNMLDQQIQNKFILVFLSANKSLDERCNASDKNIENYYIKDKNDLCIKINKILCDDSRKGNRFEGGKLLSYDYNPEYRFGYFLIEVKK
jgi:hypothetical protein